MMLYCLSIHHRYTYFTCNHDVALFIDSYSKQLVFYIATMRQCYTCIADHMYTNYSSTYTNRFVDRAVFYQSMYHSQDSDHLGVV